MSDTIQRERGFDCLYNHGSLEKIRLTSGIGAMRAFFIKTAKQDAGRAAALLNQDSAGFSALFLLLSDIDSLGLFGRLSPRNRAAVTLCAKVLTDFRFAPEIKEQFSVRSDFNHALFKWIFNTGVGDDGLNDEFDRMLDVAAAYLIQTYQDDSILPALAELIFKRNRRGRYIHDLVWALFSSRNPRILDRIAAYLRSRGPGDAALAGQLLRHTPDDDQKSRDRQQSGPYLSWLRQNRPYLYFTGECFNQTSDPAPCGVDLGAKYLCRQISPKTRQALVPLAKAERERLEAFQQTEQAEKTVLAAYSHRLHGRDPGRWQSWMELPLERQMEIAKLRSASGGLL